jgi:hypothetical protein
MRHAASALILLGALSLALPASAAEQAPRIEQLHEPVAEAAGVSLAAACANLVYFPVRFAVTVASAEVGGVTGWLTGGDRAAARSVWDSTKGQAFLTPGILQGRERLRFGE